MKKIALMLAIILCFTLVGCTSNNNDNDMSFKGQVKVPFRELWNELVPNEMYISTEKEFDDEKINSYLTKIQQLSNDTSYTEEERKFARAAYVFLEYTYGLRKVGGTIAGVHTAVANGFSNSYYAVAQELYMSWFKSENTVSDEAFKFISEMAENEKYQTSVVHRPSK